MAEAFAVQEGWSLGIDTGFRSFMLELDSWRCFSLLEHRGEDILEVGYLLTALRGRFSLALPIRLSFTRRDGNAAAYQLARSALLQRLE